MVLVLNVGAKVQINSGKTHLRDKFFIISAQIYHIRKRLRCFFRKNGGIILSLINKVLSLHKRNCKLNFAICK